MSCEFDPTSDKFSYVYSGHHPFWRPYMRHLRPVAGRFFSACYTLEYPVPLKDEDRDQLHLFDKPRR